MISNRIDSYNQGRCGGMIKEFQFRFSRDTDRWIMYDSKYQA